MWLDLSEAGESLWADLNPELSSLRAAVHERAAYLVVVLPYEPKDLGPESDQYRVRIERPASQEVLRRYLRLAGIPQPDQLLSGQLPGDNQPLREIARYVRLLTDAKERTFGQGDFVAWCTVAYSAWRGQDPRWPVLMTTLTKGPQRALLLATAMLHGSHADNVHHAAASFLGTVEHPRDESPVLERATFGERISEIKAELDASGTCGSPHSAMPGQSVRTSGIHLPDLHDHIRDWVGVLASSADSLMPNERGLVRRFTDQCLIDRYQATWVSLVKQCTAKHTPVG